jgi:hypothetical protein
MTEKTTKELFSEATFSLLGGESGCFFFDLSNKNLSKVAKN